MAVLLTSRVTRGKMMWQLCVCFPSCRMRTIWCPSNRVVLRMRWVSICEVLRKCIITLLTVSVRIKTKPLTCSCLLFQPRLWTPAPLLGAPEFCPSLQGPRHTGCCPGSSRCLSWLSFNSTHPSELLQDHACRKAFSRPSLYQVLCYIPSDHISPCTQAFLRASV